MSNKKGQKEVESQNIQQVITTHKSEMVKQPKIVYDDEKIEVEIREIIRIRPQDFSALKHSFEEWAIKWDK